MVAPEKAAKKAAYFAKLIELMETYPNVLLANADNVGSKQMADIRIALRGKAILLFGKNTMIRTCFRQHIEKNPDLGLQNLLPLMKGNIGFVFCIGDMQKVREEIGNFSVCRAARPGVLSPVDLMLPAGSCGLDPSQTSFFQALNIATKIVKGQIDVVTDTKLLKIGEKVGPSECALLTKLNIKPFNYIMEVSHVFEKGSVYSSAILEITQEVLIGHMQAAINNVAALGRKINVPTDAGMPHAIVYALKHVAAIAFAADASVEGVEPLENMCKFLKDPSAFASAAPAAAAGGAAKGGAAAPAAAAKEESEEEADMDFDLFG